MDDTLRIAVSAQADTRPQALEFRFQPDMTRSGRKIISKAIALLRESSQPLTFLKYVIPSVGSTDMIPTREELIEKADRCPQPAVVIEAFWDGDSNGWFVVLTMLYEDSSVEPPYREYDLSAMRGNSGDPRLFNGQVPPWPEAARAREVGEELSARLGIPFYFASPDEPEDRCPRWWERDQGYPCQRCGIPLLQPESHPFRGICHSCGLKEERGRKEAAWTPEERAGPRCHICGNPAQETWNSMPACASCIHKYTTYRCSRCGETTTILKGILHTDFCSQCDMMAIMEQLSMEERQSIRLEIAKRGWLRGVVKVCEISGCSIPDAKQLVRYLSEHPDA